MKRKENREEEKEKGGVPPVEATFDKLPTLPDTTCSSGSVLFRF